MIRLSPEAESHVEALIVHFERLERPEAIRNLIAALANASDNISARPRSGLAAPRPYPSLASLGLLWTKSGPYWIAYGLEGGGPIIMGVFHDTANIPGRV